MLKKGLSLFLISVLLLSFAACSKETDTANVEKKDETVQDAPAAEETPEEPEEEQPEEPDVPRSFVLLENKNFRVVASNPHVDPIWGYALDLSFENHTDKSCVLSFEDTAVNDIIISGLIYLEAEAGATAEEEVFLIGTDLELFGLEEVTKISCLVNIYDSESYEDICNEPATIYPLGEEKHEPYERAPQPDDQILVDNSACQIILTGITPDDMFGYTLHLYVINRSEKALMFSLDETKLNDVECYALWATSIPSKMQSFTDISWSESTLKEKNITDITSIFLEFYVSDANDWLADPIVKEKVEITPQ